MARDVEILIDGKKVEMREINISVSKSLSDINKYSKIGGAFTKNLSIPDTPKNRITMGGTANRFVKFIPKLFDAEITGDGVRVIKGIFTLISHETTDRSLGGYNGQIISGVNTFMKRNKNKKISDLDWGIQLLPFDVSIETVNWSKNFGEVDYILGLIDNGGINFIPPTIQLAYTQLRPFPFQLTVIQKAIEELDYTMILKGDFVNSFEFQNLIIGHLEELSPFPEEPAFAFLGLTAIELVASLPIVNPPTITTVYDAILPFDSEEDDFNNYNLATQEFTADETNDYKKKFALTFSISGTTGGVKLFVDVELFKVAGPDVLIETKTFDKILDAQISSVNKFSVQGIFSFSATINDVYYQKIKIRVYDDIVGGAKLFLEKTSENKWFKDQGVYPLHLNLPRLSIDDVFKSAQVAFNLLYIVDEERKTFTIVQDEDYRKTGKTIDWTKRLDRDKSRKHFIKSQSNQHRLLFKWVEDSKDLYIEEISKEFSWEFGDEIRESNGEFEVREVNITEGIKYATTAMKLHDNSIYIPRVTNSESNDEITGIIPRLFIKDKLQPLESGITLDLTLDFITFDSYVNIPDIFSYRPQAGATDLTMSFNNMQDKKIQDQRSDVGIVDRLYKQKVLDLLDRYIFTGQFLLTLDDFTDIDFNDIIYIDDNAHRLNAIKDLDLKVRSTTKVELIQQ